MKNLSYLLVAGLMATSLSGAAFAADQMSHEAIAERIKPVGQIYGAKELEALATAAVASAAAKTSADRDGETVYKSTCAACHDTGTAGAPMLSDKAAWKPRIAQGVDTLKKHAIGGFMGGNGMMPPRGTCAACSDAEIENAIHYMIDRQ